MTGLLAYSGITTKVRAKESRLLSEEDLREMAALETVSEALDYLKHRSSYQNIWDGCEERDMHRGAIEQRLLLSKYQDFSSLYRFSSISQRKFLDLYFLHYEIAVLKRCLRCILDHRNMDLDLSLFQDFFEKHSRLDLTGISLAETVDDLISHLKGSVFYDLLADLSDTPGVTLVDYELKMDLLYFRTMWKSLKKLSKQEENILIQCFGSKLDMLNIQWIYRSKKYYRLSSSQIYALLIPLHYKLKPEDVTKLTESSDLNEFFQNLRSTYYGSLSLTDLNETPDLEYLYEKVLNRIHRLTSRRQPYSIAALNSYLYFKELEIQKIITVIEGIRYGLDADTICSYVIKD